MKNVQEMRGFCPLKTKITQFPEGFHLNILSSWVREKFRQTEHIFDQILKTFLDCGQVLVNINVKTYLLKRRMKIIIRMTRIINRKPPPPATLAITNLVSDDKPSMV